MNSLGRLAFLADAAGLHALVLFGWRFDEASFVADVGEDEGAPVEVGVVTTAEEAPVEAAPEPPAPEPPTPPAPEEPPPPPETPEPPPPPEPMPEPPPVTPPPDAIQEPTPEPPRPTPAPRPKPKPTPAAKRPAAPAATGAPAPSGEPSGATGTPGSTGKPGKGDSAHATRKRKVEPVYPAAAKAAKQTGRVIITLSINPLGEVSGARVSQSSGFPSLDQAALAAARASTYNPKRIAGIPLPDTISASYNFKLD